MLVRLRLKARFGESDVGRVVPAGDSQNSGVTPAVG